MPSALANRIATLPRLTPVTDIVRLAREAGLAVEIVAEVYSKIGDRYGFDWLRRAAAQLSTDSAWDKLAVTAIVDDFYGHQADLVGTILNGKIKGKDVEGLIEDWAMLRQPQIARGAQLLQELRASGTPDLAMLAVANRQIKSIVVG